MGKAKAIDHVTANQTVGSCWLILLSETALRTLQQSNFLMPVFLEQAKILQKGKWSQSRSQELYHVGSKLPIYHTTLSDTFYFVWQVDVVYVHPLKAHAQVVKIWDVVYTDQVHGIIDGIISVQNTYESELLSAGRLRHEASSTKVLPHVFPSSTEGLERRRIMSSSTHDCVKLENAITTMRFVPLSKILIGCIQFGIKGEIPFLLSKEEYKVCYSFMASFSR
ncbi:hypothetical protein GOP47_0008350 [Adiantum capillus-veneris]|uniref:Uncharacterized protein n=1 Tax=Adiantum capillus-veneris TaxID=13818 RepID=A0A9D4ZKL4_ADICA|nr:hypothetical protein GOP47_0008350 [Adiantum capillus-veneris]